MLGHSQTQGHLLGQHSKDNHFPARIDAVHLRENTIKQGANEAATLVT